MIRFLPVLLCLAPLIHASGQNASTAGNSAKECAKVERYSIDEWCGHSNTVHVRIKNSCKQSIDEVHCTQLLDGKWECGGSLLHAGESAEDWVCNAKPQFFVWAKPAGADVPIPYPDKRSSGAQQSKHTTTSKSEVNSQSNANGQGGVQLSDNNGQGGFQQVGAVTGVRFSKTSRDAMDQMKNLTFIVRATQTLIVLQPVYDAISVKTPTSAIKGTYDFYTNDWQQLAAYVSTLNSQERKALWSIADATSKQLRLQAREQRNSAEEKYWANLAEELR